MFVNVDWFFLSHRLAIAKESAKRNVELTVFTDFTTDHHKHAYGDFSILQSPISRKSMGMIPSSIEFFKTFMVIKSSSGPILIISDFTLGSVINLSKQ